MERLFSLARAPHLLEATMIMLKTPRSIAHSLPPSVHLTVACLGLPYNSASSPNPEPLS